MENLSDEMSKTALSSPREDAKETPSLKPIPKLMAIPPELRNIITSWVAKNPTPLGMYFTRTVDGTYQITASTQRELQNAKALTQVSKALRAETQNLPWKLVVVFFGDWFPDVLEELEATTDVFLAKFKPSPQNTLKAVNLRNNGAGGHIHRSGWHILRYTGVIANLAKLASKFPASTQVNIHIEEHFVLYEDYVRGTDSDAPEYWRPRLVLSGKEILGRGREVERWVRESGCEVDVRKRNWRIIPRVYDVDTMLRVAERDLKEQMPEEYQVVMRWCCEGF